MYRVTVDVRQHLTDDSEAEYPSCTKLLCAYVLRAYRYVTSLLSVRTPGSGRDMGAAGAPLPPRNDA
jgi:hypothetical protein